MKKWLLVVVPLAGLGVWLVLHAISTQKPHAAIEHASVATSSATPAQSIVTTDGSVALRVAALNSEVSALRAELTRVSQPPATATNDSGSEARLETPEQARQNWREHMDQVAIEYDLETRDARWARDTESKLQGVLSASRALGDAVESLDCRSASCRIQLKPSQAANFEDDLLRAVHEVGSFLPETQFDAADPGQGKRFTVIYLKTGAG